MAELKTRENDASVDAFLSGIEDEAKRADAQAVAAMMQDVTGHGPRMWGAAIIGYGKKHLVYESGRELDWFEVGFSPRKRNITLYIMPGFSEYEALLSRLGKHKTGKSCLYVNKLADVDTGVLRELVAQSVEAMRNR